MSPKRKTIYPKCHLKYYGWGTLYNPNDTLLNALVGDLMLLFVSDQPYGEEHSHNHYITCTEVLRIFDKVGTGLKVGRPRRQKIKHYDWPSPIPQSTLNMGSTTRSDKRYSDGLSSKSAYYIKNVKPQEYMKRTRISALTLWKNYQTHKEPSKGRSHGGARKPLHSRELLHQEQVRTFIKACRLERPKSPFVDLIRKRCELWLMGCPVGQVRDIMGLSQNELKYLDGLVGQYVALPANQGRLDTLDARKMKSGVASKILRQHKHGYFSAQPLPNHRDKPSG